MLQLTEKVSALVTIPDGHKLAVRDIAPGQPVRRYTAPWTIGATM